MHTSNSEALKYLADLAMKFRGSSGDQRHPIAEQYNSALQELMATGWNDWLDPDSELPDELMDQAYLDRRSSQNRSASYLLRDAVRSYDALLMHVQSMGPQKYTGQVTRIYSRRFEGPVAYDSDHLSFIGGGGSWGNRTLVSGESAVVFLSYTGNSYHQKPWHGHFTRELINDRDVVLAHWRLLDAKEEWRPDYLRAAAFLPEHARPSRVALPFELFEKHLLEELALLA